MFGNIWRSRFLETKICWTGPSGSVLNADLCCACLPLGHLSCLPQKSAMTERLKTTLLLPQKLQEHNLIKIGVLVHSNRILWTDATIEGFYQMTWQWKSYRLVDSVLTVEGLRECVRVVECWPGVILWQLTSNLSPTTYKYDRDAQDSLGGQFRTG